MSHTRLWIAAGIIAIVVVGGFVLSVPHTSEVRDTASTKSAPTVPTVAIHDAYKKGVHTITGSVTAPDACAQISAAASLAGATSSPNILIAVSLTDNAGVCLDLPTEMPFKLTQSAPANATIMVTVNGEDASTTGL